MPTDDVANKAVVALIEKDDKILCVWNKRYLCWLMPGGKVEDKESLEEALIREVKEEVGLDISSLNFVFNGKHNMKVDSTRGSMIFLYRAKTVGEPKQCEDNSPIIWISPQDWLKIIPEQLANFYQNVFKN